MPKELSHFSLHCQLGSSKHVISLDSVYSLVVPLLADCNAGKSIMEPGTSGNVRQVSLTDQEIPEAEQSLEKELLFIRRAKESGVVYLLGHGDVRARKDSWFIKKLVINYFYAFLRKNSRRGIKNLNVPRNNLMQEPMGRPKPALGWCGTQPVWHLCPGSLLFWV
ncbi:hypothetical protein MRB53_010346 [Persea americana]|uniref:Uncharacterized protein n=1 Tax=Persea americana TaxID=3435 RepID=A0ACC2LRQ0_PERAE|nr:hypothetical protein MRB53_010346 [Persea americana]